MASVRVWIRNNGDELVAFDYPNGATSGIIASPVVDGATLIEVVNADDRFLLAVWYTPVGFELNVDDSSQDPEPGDTGDATGGGGGASVPPPPTSGAGSSGAALVLPDEEAEAVPAGGFSAWLKKKQEQRERVAANDTVGE